MNGQVAILCKIQSLSVCLQDLHKVEAKLREKQLREKEEEERQRRIAAKLKEKVGHIACHRISKKLFTKRQTQNLKTFISSSFRWMVTLAETPPGLPVPLKDGRSE